MNCHPLTGFDAQYSQLCLGIFHFQKSPRSYVSLFFFTHSADIVPRFGC